MESMSAEMSEVVDQLRASPAEMLGAVIAATGIYLAFLVLVRIFGPRSLNGMSTFDAILVIMFGAVAGRVILGFTPTLLTGIIGLTTLFVLEAFLGQVRATARGTKMLNSRPVLVFAASEPLPAAMRRMHLTDVELHSAFRRAGVRSRDEVACAIFEPTGHLSILRYGAPIDPHLVADVVGREKIPDALLARPSEGER